MKTTIIRHPRGGITPHFRPEHLAARDASRRQRTASRGPRGGEPPSPVRLQPGVLYEVPVTGLHLGVGDQLVDVSTCLSSGRVNYVLFQRIIARFGGLSDGHEGVGPDLHADDGATFEVKSFYDVDLHPADRFDATHVASSSTFGPNNLGPKVKELLAGGDYDEAFALCRTHGYDHNEFYVLTNTRNYDTSVPLRFVVVPTTRLLGLLDPADPRVVCRHQVLATAERVVRLA